MGPGHHMMIAFLLSLLLLCAQEKEKLASLERRYQLVTGGRSFPKMSSALKEVTGEMGHCPESCSPVCWAVPIPRDKTGALQFMSAAVPLLPSAICLKLGTCTTPGLSVGCRD